MLVNAEEVDLVENDINVELDPKPSWSKKYGHH